MSFQTCAISFCFVSAGPKKSSAEIKQLVKDFVREMVKSKEMEVLRADGSRMAVKCGLTRPQIEDPRNSSVAQGWT